MEQVSVYFEREVVGTLLKDSINTIGQLLEESVKLLPSHLKFPLNLQKYLNSEVIPHTNWCYLLLSNRYLYSNSFLNLKDVYSVGLTNQIVRKMANLTLVDIPYGILTQIHIFHTLPNWNSLLELEKTQVQILGIHSQYVSTRDIKYRNANQGLRRQLNTDLGLLLQPLPQKSSLDTLIKIPTETFTTSYIDTKSLLTIIHELKSKELSLTPQSDTDVTSLNSNNNLIHTPQKTDFELVQDYNDLMLINTLQKSLDIPSIPQIPVGWTKKDLDRLSQLGINLVLN